MLNLSETRIGKSFHRTVKTGKEIKQEGTPLVYVREGEGTVVDEAGASAGVWAGVALSRNNSLTRAVEMEEAVIPANLDSGGTPTAPFTLTLVNTPLAGSYRVELNGSDMGASVAIGSLATGKYNLTGKVLTFDLADIGKTVNVSYAYAPTVEQALAKTGTAPSGGLPSSAMGVIGVINEGDISTDMFDTSVDWSASNILAVYAKNGLFTTDNSGTLVPGAVILRAPVAGSPSLTISLR